MKTHTKLTALGTGLLVGTAVLAAPSPALSAPKNEPAPGTACYDILEGGSAALTRDRAVTTTAYTELTFPHEKADLGATDATGTGAHTHVVAVADLVVPDLPHGKALSVVTRTPTDDVHVEVNVRVPWPAGADCSDARYRLRIFDDTAAQTLVTDMVVMVAPSADPGFGDVRWKTTFRYPASDPARSVLLAVTSETSTGRVVDSSPDAPQLLVLLDDGTGAGTMSG